MSRWTPDEHGCIYDEAGCFARLTPNKAERLASRHNADIDALTDERDAAIDEKLFWVDKYAYEMEKSDRHCDQWQRCFRLAFGLKNKYYSKLRTATAERDELQRRLDNVVAMLEPAPDEKLQKMYAEDLHVEYTLRELYPRACAIAEGREG